jgi:hypothetical protein
MVRYSRSADGTGCLVFVVIAALGLGGSTIVNLLTREQFNATITAAPLQSNSRDDRYLVSVYRDGRDYSLQNKQEWLLGKFGKSDLQGQLNRLEGQCVRVEAAGIRFEAFAWKPNVLRVVGENATGCVAPE